MLKRIGILSIIGILLLLYVVNPEHSVLMPKCPFHLLTGLQCPACGTQRALHQLLHLNFEQAFWYNPFLILSAPYLTTLVFVQWYSSDNRFQRLKSICHHHTVVNTYLVLIVTWWIARNLL